MTNTDDGRARAFTAAELQEQFLDGCRTVADYWAGLPDKTPHERTSGALHSFLCLIDGVSSGFMCALDLTTSPHPDDKAFHKSEGENWAEPGTVINEDMLHELLYGRGRWSGRPVERGGIVSRNDNGTTEGAS